MVDRWSHSGVASGPPSSVRSAHGGGAWPERVVRTAQAPPGRRWIAARPIARPAIHYLPPQRLRSPSAPRFLLFQSCVCPPPTPGLDTPQSAPRFLLLSGARAGAGVPVSRWAGYCRPNGTRGSSAVAPPPLLAVISGGRSTIGRLACSCPAARRGAG